MWITHATPLLTSIDQIQLATTYAWASNEPESKYYEQSPEVRERHLSDLDKACEAYLQLRGRIPNLSLKENVPVDNQ